MRVASIEVVDVALTDEERAALHRSAGAVQQVVSVMDARREEIDPSLGPMTTGIKIG